MYLVGVVPGPRSPSVIRGQISHSVKLAVDDLQKFRQGVHFTRTYNYPEGRLCKSLCIDIITDALACREIAGFPSPSSLYPCTSCHLKKSEMGNLNRQSWPRRDLREHKRLAKAWWDAETFAEQKTLFKSHYLRWSEFNRLDYFNIILYTPSDLPHTGYLNAAQTHFREIFGIDFEKPGGDGQPISVSDPNAMNVDLIRPSLHGNAVLGEDVMKEIYRDMDNIFLPTWMDSAPRDWGSARRGKLKANEWKMLTLVHVPITLIRLWGTHPVERKRDMLDNFMALAQALRIADFHSLQRQDIFSFNKHITHYLKTLQELYQASDESILKPHHHALMHMGEDLAFMGPNHARNTMPCERYIHFMQNRNLNNQFGMFYIIGLVVHN
ncbi:hypothetical protein K435DRAFT_684902 [Dendrothele bispora CBS 962.96]|uniref:Uncharacterized protein n=1 Tax=Dendrothele bispora (strain CBS 962.96) TaxID=1314807 RepID=A0A4S8LBV1_DENBC|nr:hypothetical protein K435DRAFT_684902 [Dendrothele bispora CBS 962.96]